MRWHKYGAKKVTIDGIKFDSRGEAALYVYYRDNDDYEIISMQDKIYLTKARILFKPDFYIEDKVMNKRYYSDFKGFCTPVFNIKKRLWKAYRSDELHVIVKKGKKFITKEIVCGSA